MKTYLFKLFLLPLLMLTALNLFSQETSNLNIIKGKVDTTHSSTHYIIGVAPKGSLIYVNDNIVKQYETGAFGAELKLNNGENRVVVKSIYKDKEELVDFLVYYKEQSLVEPSKAKELYLSPVVITKKGAYLNSSFAGDRLGGNKLNFLPTGIKMELLEEKNNLFKVRLSHNRTAYIPKECVEILPLGEAPAFSVSGSWSVSPGSGYDRVRLTLQERQPYIVYRSVVPNRIIVELHGVNNNSNWITQYSGLKAIESVNLEQSQSDVLKVIIDLKERYSWGYSIDYVGNNLEILVKHTPTALYQKQKLPLKGLVVGLDAGHGGSASGAISTTGAKEKDLNLEMVMLLKELFERRGAQVVLSRKGDYDLSMQERIEIFNNANIDLLLSVHCNAGGNPLKPMGTSTYYKHIEDRELALSILNNLTTLKIGEFGLVGNFNFSLNSPTNYPAVLVETLFMSSLPDEELLLSPKFRKELMERVLNGVEEYISNVRKQLLQ